jgi:methyl-accepting chemotaxis protein
VSIAGQFLALGAVLAALAIAAATTGFAQPEAAVAGAAAAFLSGVWLARRAHRRLADVARVADQIATGCRGVKLPPLRRDEAGRLLQSIALMARSIEALEAQCWQASQDLDTARVRIEELSARAAPPERRPTGPVPAGPSRIVARTRHRDA